MKKGQSNRLTEQQKEGQGPVTIFHKDAKFHDAEVGSTSELAKMNFLCLNLDTEKIYQRRK